MPRLLLAAALFVPIGGPAMADQPLHLLFWQDDDVREAESVAFTARPFPEERIEVLLETDRPSLWHMPIAALPGPEGARIYYQRVERGQAEWVQQRTLCLGILDERGFDRPDLGLFEQAWDGPRNVVMQRSPHTPTWGGFNVHQIIGDAQTGYTMLYWDQPEEGLAGAMLATSDDGIHWRKDPRGTVFTEHNDAYTLRRDEEADGYILYQTMLRDWPEKPYPDNLAGRRRIQTIRRSSDLVNWTPQEVMLEPDEADGEAAEFYLVKTFRHVDRYVGLLMKYYANPDRPNRHSDIVPHELIFSRDGVSWQRPYRDVEPGLWSYADPFEHDGDFCLVAHRDGHLVLARVRADGLASVGAEGWGAFRTPSFTMPQGDLLLNADCRLGAVEIELIHGGRVIGRCALAGVEGTELPLRWEQGVGERVAGESVELRVRLAQARIYALTAAR